MQWGQYTSNAPFEVRQEQRLEPGYTQLGKHIAEGKEKVLPRAFGETLQKLFVGYGGVQSAVLEHN
jgi:hypothetical protein